MAASRPGRSLAGNSRLFRPDRSLTLASRGCNACPRKTLVLRMSTDHSSSIARASRIIGLGLLTHSLSSCSGSPTEVRYNHYMALACGLWCFVEIVLTYFKRPS
jgi:hypothetical protein